MKKTILLLTIAAFPAAAATIAMLPTFVITPEAYWGVDDPEPMVVTYGPDGPSFSRLGDEQCLDKMLGTVPCDELTEEFFAPPGEAQPTVDEASTVTPPTSMDDPYGPFWPPLIYIPPGDSTKPPVKIEEPEPSPVPMSGTFIYLLSSIGLVAGLYRFLPE